MWAREPKDADGKRGGIKESTRWIEGYERIAERAAELPGTRLVYMADREADIAALMQRADELGTPADWLIRSTHNRSLEGGDRLWQKARTVKQSLRMKGAGAIRDRGMAYRLPDTHGQDVPGPGCCTVLRSGRDSPHLPVDEKANAQGQAKTERSSTSRGTTRRLPCAQGRRRAWCQNDLGGLAARYHIRRNATCASE